MWLSKCSSVSGHPPWCSLSALRMGYEMVWSPPRNTGMRRTRGSSAATCRRISSTARRLSKGVQGRSPRSATRPTSKGDTPCSGLYPRSRRDAWRMALGPKRAPGR